jgi:abhydrolase domain-containing protein 6
VPTIRFAHLCRSAPCLALLLAGPGCVPTVRAGDAHVAPHVVASSEISLPRATYRVLSPPATCREALGPILFLHGLGDTAYPWNRLTRGLTACRARLLVDLPGIGSPDWPSRRDVGPDRANADADDVLRALEDVILAESPDQPVVLVGHSLGGTIALRLAAKLPERVGALVLITAPTGPLDLDDRQLLAIEGADLLVPPLRLAGPWAISEWLLAGMDPDPTMVALVAKQWSDSRHFRAIAGYYASFLAPKPLELLGGDIARLRAPTLLLSGGNDGLIPIAMAERVRDGAPPTTPVTLTTLDGVGHFAPHTHPDRIAEAIDRFLEVPAPDLENRSPPVVLPMVAPVTPPDPAPPRRREIGRRLLDEQIQPGDRLYGPLDEIYPVIGAGALFPSAGGWDAFAVLGVARGSVDAHYPLETGRVVVTAGAAMREDTVKGPGWAFAYLRSTIRVEMIWRYAGGFHLDTTLLLDPEEGSAGVYNAIGYAPSILPWVRAFVGAGILPDVAPGPLAGIELNLSPTTILF